MKIINAILTLGLIATLSGCDLGSKKSSNNQNGGNTGSGIEEPAPPFIVRISEAELEFIASGDANEISTHLGDRTAYADIRSAALGLARSYDDSTVVADALENYGEYCGIVTGQGQDGDLVYGRGDFGRNDLAECRVMWGVMTQAARNMQKTEQRYTELRISVGAYDFDILHDYVAPRNSAVGSWDIDDSITFSNDNYALKGGADLVEDSYGYVFIDGSYDVVKNGRTLETISVEGEGQISDYGLACGWIKYTTSQNISYTKNFGRCDSF